jgi:hypothetical protein
MRKVPTILFTSATLAVCLIMAQYTPLSNSSNTSFAKTIVLSGTLIPPTGIKKYLCAYGFAGGFPDEIADFIAEHFDLLVADYSEASVPGFERIKSKNPNLIILVYRDMIGVYPSNQLENPDWDVINQHESWFIHDKAGNRVENEYWGWYLMDVGNDGWRNHYASWCQTVLQEKSIDGIFADDVWDSLPCGSFPDAWYNPWTVPNSQIDQAIGNRWHNDTLGCIAYIKQGIGAKLLIVNSVNNDDYVNACDGKLEEEFVHPSWYPYSEFDDNYINWTEKIEGVKQIGESGKYVLVDSGFAELSQSASQEMIDRMLMYCFSSYLLALEGDNSFFSFGNYWSTNTSRGYYPLFDESKSLGAATDEYYSFQSVYARDFQRGFVIVNPTDSIHSISLSHSYRTSNGQEVSNVTLGDHTGIILLSG